MSADWILLGLRLLAPILLYTFLGLMIRQMVSVQSRRPIAACLRRLDDPAITLSLQDNNTLGREPGNSLVIVDDFVSAWHARLTFEAGRWWLTDLDSTNGTLVNDRPVEQRTPLAYGDVIRLGEVQLRLEHGG
jgi:hypothetical protein